MSFQKNARATFAWRSFSGKASIVAIGATFGTSLAVISVPQQSLPLAYSFLLNMACLVVVIFYMTTEPPVNLFRGAKRWYTLREIWRPIAFGVGIVLVAVVGLLLFTTFPLAPNSISDNARYVILYAAYIGFVEEFMRWVWIQVLPYGLVTANFLWILLHPEVAPVLNGQPWSPFFAVIALGFGFFATWTMWAYESAFPGEFNRYLGPIFAATIHAGYDAIAIIWKIAIVVPGAGLAIFGPMAAPAVLVLFPLTLLLAVILAKARGARSSSGGPSHAQEV